MKSKGLTLSELAVVIATTTMLAGILMPVAGRSRWTAIGVACRKNLKNIGRAMKVYANDNDGEYPRAGGAGGVWTDQGNINNWGGAECSEAAAFGYNLDWDPPVRGAATITSSFFLLIKHAAMKPKQFLCIGDGAQEFRLSDQNRVRIGDIGLAWDFGDGGNTDNIYPGGYCSYSYHLPYSRKAGDTTSFEITDQSNPRMPVCADRNPFLDANADDPQVGDNSAVHSGKGQNVLYRNGSARFQKRPTAGIRGDNIYTYGGDRDGTPPAGNGRGFPTGEKDAYLVGEHNHNM